MPTTANKRARGLLIISPTFRCIVYKFPSHTMFASLQNNQEPISIPKGVLILMGQGQSGNNNILVVPQANQALQQLKYEVAQELGIQIPQDGYYGYMATRDTGAIGGHMVRRMVQIAESQLAGTMQGQGR
jgi:hypothetical protein